MQIERRILLIPDEAASNGDPFDDDVGDKDLLKYPLLPGDRVLTFEIRAPKVASTSKDRTKEQMSEPAWTNDEGRGKKSEQLVVPCYTQEDLVSTEGQQLKKGFVIYHRISITASAKRNVDQIKKDIALLCQSIGLSGIKVGQLLTDPKQYLDGKKFQATVKILPAKDDFPESNTLRPMIPG